MDELVDHDVVAQSGRFTRVSHVVPGECHRAAFHRFACQHLVIVVHYADFVGHFAASDHLIVVQHDADEAVVQGEPEPQHRQASLRGDGDGRFVGDDEAACTGEFLAPEKQRAQTAQFGQVFCWAPREERVVRQHSVPQLQRNLMLAQQLLFSCALPA